jgi:hypothetical protein
MQTDFSTLTTSQKRIWSARVWAAGRDATLLFGKQGFMGSGTEDTTRSPSTSSPTSPSPTAAIRS